jgi:hypothetical protein
VTGSIPNLPLDAFVDSKLDDIAGVFHEVVGVPLQGHILESRREVLAGNLPGREVPKPRNDVDTSDPLHSVSPVLGPVSVTGIYRCRNERCESCVGGSELPALRP